MTEPTPTVPAAFVGIDVSKAHLDVAVRPAGEAFRLANDPAGHAELAGRLAALAPALVVLEATGGYELPAVAALQAAGIATAAINPRQARRFAEATGRLAKTDRIDAEALAHFAEAVRPEPCPAPEPERAALDALVSRRRQLLEMRVMESNRLGACTDPAVHAGLERHLAWLDTEPADTERALAEAVQASPAWRQRDELLRSIPGIGPATSRTLLAALPELGTADGGRLASLAGLAPHARDSGLRCRPRAIRGGRPEVRRALYLAALSAARHAGPLKDFADRLKARGKRAKVILIAVARRLLVIANAMVRTATPWRPELAAARGATLNP
jgi:transposase